MHREWVKIAKPRKPPQSREDMRSITIHLDGDIYRFLQDKIEDRLNGKATKNDFYTYALVLLLQDHDMPIPKKTLRRMVSVGLIS